MPAPSILSAAFLCLSLQVGLAAAELVVPENIQFDQGIEYANPDNQHLQLNIARPKNATGILPCVLCIHGGGFRAGNRDSYNGLLIELAGRIMWRFRSAIAWHRSINSRPPSMM
jgi:acetyl esterase/lipase